MTLHRKVYLVVAGLMWGSLGALLGGKAFGEAIWLALLVSPLIGLLVGHLMQDVFERHAGVRRALIALGSLYLSATLFGVSLGAGAVLGRTGGGPGVLSQIADSTLAVWWGITVTGFLIVLWPLAYGTHWFIEWRTDR